MAIHRARRFGAWEDGNQSETSFFLRTPTGSSSASSLRSSEKSADKKPKREVYESFGLARVAREREKTSESSSSSIRSASRNDNTAKSSPAESNPWVRINSLAEHMSALTGRPPSFFVSYFHDRRYISLYDAARQALRFCEQGPSNPSSHLSDAIIYDIFASHLENEDLTIRQKDELREDLALCTAACGNDVASVLDLMDVLDELSDDHFEGGSTLTLIEPATRTTAIVSQAMARSSSLPGSSSTKEALSELKRKPAAAPIMPDIERVIPGSRPYTASVPSSPIPRFTDLGADGVSGVSLPSSSSRKHRKGQSASEPWKEVKPRVRRKRVIYHPHAGHIPSYSRGALPNDPTPGPLFRPPSQLLLQDVRSRSAAAHAARNAALQQAIARSTTGGGRKDQNMLITSTYHEIAREKANEARSLDLQGARLVVEAQLSGSSTIDLHLMYIDEATEAALHAARMLADRMKNRSLAPTRLTVVTGVGKHSAGGKGVIGPPVIKALEAEGFKVERAAGSRGYFTVTGRS